MVLGHLDHEVEVVKKTAFDVISALELVALALADVALVHLLQRPSKQPLLALAHSAVHVEERDGN